MVRNMKKYLLLFLIIIIFICLLPLFALLAPKASNENKPTLKGGPIILVYDNGNITEQNLEEYLVGVIAAEMPALYEIEALKAQAVAARSYILSRKGKDNPDHKGADVCTDSAHCKAYISPEDATEKWGEEHSKEYLNKIQTAVSETCGEYLSYDNQPVVACFYAVSGGKTENAKDVWGGDVPYLRSVDSSVDLSYEGLEDVISFPKESAMSLLETNDLNVSEVKKTEGGSVSSLKIGNKSFTGGQIRSLFGLNSSNFEISLSENDITFTTKGKGHGVGMSQYGANIMAKDGKKYTEILLHYYSNVTIEKITEI